MANKTTCYWEGKSNDGSYEVRSNQNFDTIEDCYNDMRDAVLEKMKWNTNYDADFDVRDENNEPITHEENHIHYNVHFFPRKIIHESYSGVYTYEIKTSEPFSVLFEKMWCEKIKHFAEHKTRLKYIGATLWVTDCSDNSALWAEWFEKTYGAKSVEDTFVSCDIYFPTNTTWAKEKEDYISSQLNLKPYDNQGTDNVFWRIDTLGANELNGLEKTLTKINDALTPIVCNKFELLNLDKSIVFGLMNTAHDRVTAILSRNGVPTE